MAMVDHLRRMVGMAPRRAEFSDTAPRPVATVISEMMHASGRVTRAQALSVPAVKRGRDIICGLANLPLQTIDAQRHVVLTPLLQQIDPNVADPVTIAQTFEDLLFDAVSWWEIIEFGEDGYPSKARHLDVSQVTVNPPANGKTPAPLPSGLDPRGEILVDGRRVSIERIIKFDSPNPPLLAVGGRVIRRAIALDTAAEMYANDPRPMDYFTPKDENVDPASDDEINAVLSKWQAWRRKRSTGYVPAALRYNEVQQPTPADLQLVALQQRAALDIANLIGLDPEDLGVSTTSRTYQNAVDRRVDRYNDVLASYASALTARLSMGDVTKMGQSVRIKLDSFLRADAKTRTEVQGARLAMGATTLDEIREEEGLPPLAAPAPVARPAPVIQATVGRPAAQLQAHAELAADDGLSFESDAVSASFTVDEVRRTMTGLALPWNEQARKNGRLYRFARGGQRYGKLDRIKFLEDHDWSRSFGRAIGLDDTAEGLVPTFKVARGEHGDKMLALAADKAKDGLSVGVVWDPADEVRDPLYPGGWLVKTYHIREVSLLANPAFDSSRLTSVTATHDGGKMDTCATCGATLVLGVAHTCPTGPDATAPVETAAVVSFSAAQFEQLLTRMGNPQTPPADDQTPPGGGRQVVNPIGAGATFVAEPLPYRFSMDGGMRRGPNGHDFSSDIIAAGKLQDGEAKARVEAFIAAQFDTDRADVAALNPSRQRPDLYVDQMDFITPLWDMVNRGTLEDSTPFIVPKFNTSSGLVGPHTEGVEPVAGAITATSQTITPVAVSGKVEITREAWDQGGNPQLSTIVWRQMLREYYEDREAAVATFLNTLVAATDITVTAGAGTNASDLISVASLEDAITLLQFVRGGNRFSAFAAHVDLYKVFARVDDTTGRPMYPQINPVNSNGTAQPLWRYIDVGGVRMVPAWALGATGVVAANSWLFDPAKVHGWASAPQRLQFEYQVKSIEVGIWGYTAMANTDIAGVRQVIYDPVA
jgi:portal protein